MEYRSLNDMNELIFLNIHKIPSDIDLVVGVPRSGIIPACVIALYSHLPFQDLSAFLEGATPKVGRTAADTVNLPQKPRKVLIVDDSVASGKSMRSVKEQVASQRADVSAVYMAVYSSTPYHADVDLSLEVVPMPRVFQWNLMRHKRLGDACFDIDGVLCYDPTDAENDDGDGYAKFLLNARPLLRSRVKIKHLVTSRLEKYRPETERWLQQNGIEYERLWMLDLPTAEERRRTGAHASHKAAVYKATGASLFVESEHQQAQEIANLSGKPVLSIEEQELLWPESAGRAARRKYARRLRTRQEGALHTIARDFLVPLIGKRNVKTLKRLVNKVRGRRSSSSSKAAV